MHHMTTIGKSGRLVIPVEYRRELGLNEGKGVMISLIEGHIEISLVDETIKQAQKKVRQYLEPETDLVEILFNDRKEDLVNES